MQNRKILHLAVLWLFVGVLSLKAQQPTIVEQDHGNYYVEPRSYGTRRIDGTRPGYVKKLSETSIGILSDIRWIVAGFEQRTRYEYRENDLRRPNAAGATAEKPNLDQPILLRTRLFLKVEEILDPFRFTVELQDSRRYNSDYARDDRDFNTLEPIQFFGELYCKNLFGNERPLHIRLGRMAFEFLDRRLIALNEWRNTTNTFQGVRVTVGQEKNDWHLELLGVQPLARYMDKLDDIQGKQWLYGAIFSLQQFSDWITLQPFYLALQQDSQTPTAENPELLPRDFQHIHTAGARAYAVFAKSGFDYDFSYSRQWGKDALLSNGETRQQNAFALTAELGYTFAYRLKPRLALFYAFVSGDLDRTDLTQNRFNRLYGFARPWSANDYFQMENLENPKIILELQPLENLRIDTAYAWYRAASPVDRWNNAQILNTPTAEGNLNTESRIGEEYNIRVRYPFPYLKVNVGYAFFRPGEYTTKFKRGGDTHFMYIELSAVLFG